MELLLHEKCDTITTLNKLPNSTAEMDHPKYAKFDVSEATYKVVNEQNIEAFVLVPKGLPHGKYPLLVEFHGGFFVTGGALYPEWFADWILEYCVQHSAIIVSANYRLLPESNGTDIMEDVSDFWTWIREDLQSYLTRVKPGIEADLSKVIVHGGSAGGTLALQSGLTQPQGFIKAVIAGYPGLGLWAPLTAPIMGAPTIPPIVLEEYLTNLQPGKIATSAHPPERMQIALCMRQQGITGKFYGSNESSYPMKVVQKAHHIPFLFLFHGKNDIAVPAEGSIQFAEFVKERFGSSNIDLRTEAGDHGFDMTATLETPWLKDGLTRVTELWLS
ncbi:hypothetical protein G7Y89_g5253 [Cudoniella acicularis]|uniref:Alpha/beta hydrolase fold-3 domain-containing protein n=1 Tax=Cudoniella acicularis TaxID=354080 RepID=A0A8H4W460_9HELO|nr:hypothetical protein G7Y89_g5253 [Cudoniella acicularis]